MAHGRLADPNCTLGTDPRADPRMVELLAQFGMDVPVPPPPVTVDSPLAEYARDATAFAGTARDDELSGLPPHVISLNELDPLRDAALVYYRRLVRAGVPTAGRMVAGTCHGGDLLVAAAMPEVFAATMRDVSGFATSLV